MQIAQWKRAVQDDMPRVVSSRHGRREQEEEALKATVSQQIGPRKVEVDWWKKKWDFPVDTKRQTVEVDHPPSSLRRQGALRGRPRSRLYDQAQGGGEATLPLRRLLAAPYTATPCDGMRRMTAGLHMQGDQVNQTRVARLRRQMGMEAIYTKPNLSPASAGQAIAPYVLHGVKVARVNQVWSTDSPSRRLHQGLVSLVAVRDWCSRYVRSGTLSVTLDGQFCREALTQALCQGERLEIFNTDQGIEYFIFCIIEKWLNGVRLTLPRLTLLWRKGWHRPHPR